MTTTLAAVERRPRRRSAVSTGLLGLVLVLWIVSLARTNVDAIGALGLLSAFPITMYAALAVLTISMARAVQREESGRFLAAHVVLFILIAHGTPALLYETLRYSWAWKHLGLVDHLARRHTVDPHLNDLNVYQSWPGFFSAAATWLVGSHASSWIGPAQWAPVFFELLDVLALYAVFDVLDADHRVVWTALWLFAIGDWIGQDYFSPQALAFFLYLVVLLVALRWLGRRPDFPHRLTRFATRTPHRLESPALRPAPVPARRLAAIATIVLCTAAVATSHPLTPFVLFVALALLTLAGVLTARRLWLGTGAVVAIWLATGAQGFVRATLPSVLGGLAAFGGTVDQGVAASAQASASQRLVSIMGRAEVALIVVLAIAGVVARVRRGRFDTAAIVLVVAPIAILVGGSYGGEAIFRVYLFALPFLAYLAAAACYPAPGASRSRPALLVVAVSTVVLTGFLFGYFGKEGWAHFSTGEVRAAETVFGSAPPHSLVVDGIGDYPIGFANVENVTYVHLSGEPPREVAALLAAPEPTLYDWLADTSYARGYVVIMRSEKDEADALGVLPRGALDRIETALLASPRFVVLYHDKDASAFTVARADVVRSR